jgi:hypothetical protein
MTKPVKPIRNYSLRTLLLMFLLAGAPFALIRHQYERRTAQAAAAADLKQHGFLIGYGDPGPSPTTNLPWQGTPTRGPDWLHSVLGLDFFASPASMIIQNRERYSAAHYRRFSDTDLALLKYFPNLRILSLEHCSVGDDSIRAIARLKSLEVLRIRHTRFTAEGVEHLQRSLPDCDIRW